MPKRCSHQHYRHEADHGHEVADEEKWPVFLRQDVKNAPSWSQLSSIDRLPKNPLRMSLYLKCVRLACDRDLQRALDRFRRKVPPSDEDLDKAQQVCVVASLIETAHLERRDQLAEEIPLDASAFEGELLNLKLLCWIMQCQCNMLRFVLVEQEESRACGADFIHLDTQLKIIVYRDRPICDYPLSVVRLAMARIIKNWASLPVLNDEFIHYLRLLRLRISVLQSIALDSTEVFDFPEWCKKAGKYNNVTLYRVSTNFSRLMELYFYHLDRHIGHERAFREASIALPPDMCSDGDAQHLKQWMEKRRGEMLLDQWRRETNSIAILTAILPPEREAYRHDNPQANVDAKGIIQYFRKNERDYLNEMLVGEADTLFSHAPVIAAVVQMMFLLQAEAGSFDFERYVFWHTDIPAEADGCAYPQPHYFINMPMPVLYVPLSMQNFYLAVNGKLYACGSNVYMALAAWLRVTCGVTWQHKDRNPLMDGRFDLLRKNLLRENYDSPVLFKHKNSQPPKADAAQSLEELLASLDEPFKEDTLEPMAF